MVTLRDYQVRIANDATEKLKVRGLVCLFMEVRTGKTITAMQTASNYGAKNVLFITKLKAISSIQTDYSKFNFTFDLTCINRESLHKVKGNFDLVIVDEVHGYSSFPKPSKSQKEVKQRFGHLPMILLSGTPTPESYSQFYHIFDLSLRSPFKEYKNFYQWAKKYVDVKQRNLGYGLVNDYSNARYGDFMQLVKGYIITFTQKEAGFTSEVNEMVLECEMNELTYKLIDKIQSDLYLRSKDGQLAVADTALKLMQKTHQLYSGTIKFEDGSYRVLDYSKAEFIKRSFEGKKIGIFYKFKAEWQMLKEVFGDNLTDNLKEFDSTNKNIALQIQSGREGISLRNAEALVFMNIDFSAVSYWQGRDRLTTMDRLKNNVFWIFAKNGIEHKIYKQVIKKKDFTTKHFNHEFPNKAKTTTRSSRLYGS